MIYAEVLLHARCCIFPNIPQYLPALSRRRSLITVLPWSLVIGAIAAKQAGLSRSPARAFVDYSGRWCVWQVASGDPRDGLDRCHLDAKALGEKRSDEEIQQAQGPSRNVSTAPRGVRRLSLPISVRFGCVSLSLHDGGIVGENLVRTDDLRVFDLLRMPMSVNIDVVEDSLHVASIDRVSRCTNIWACACFEFDPTSRN